VKARARLPIVHPGRLNPKGAPSGRWAKPPSDRQELSKGQKPRNRGSSGPAYCFGSGITGGRNGRWDHSGGKPAEYLSRGESSEG
jgi:hypothetical protein